MAMTTLGARAAASQPAGLRTIPAGWPGREAGRGVLGALTARIGELERQVAHSEAERSTQVATIRALSRQAQWGIVVGGYFGYRALGAVAQSNAALAPYAWADRGFL